MQEEPGKIDLGSINGIFSPLSSVTHCHQRRLLLSSRRARGRAAGLAAVVQRGGTGSMAEIGTVIPLCPEPRSWFSCHSGLQELGELPEAEKAGTHCWWHRGGSCSCSELSC